MTLIIASAPEFFGVLGHFRNRRLFERVSLTQHLLHSSRVGERRRIVAMPSIGKHRTDPRTSLICRSGIVSVVVIIMAAPVGRHTKGRLSWSISSGHFFPINAPISNKFTGIFDFSPRIHRLPTYESSSPSAFPTLLSIMYNSPVRPFHRLTIVLTVLTLSIFVSMSAHAQKSVHQTEPVTSPAQSGASADTAQVPSGIPTRETFQTGNPGAQSVGPTAGDYFRIFAGLIIVLLVIWGLSVLMKRFVTVERVRRID